MLFFSFFFTFGCQFVYSYLVSLHTFGFEKSLPNGCLVLFRVSNICLQTVISEVEGQEEIQSQVLTIYATERHIFMKM